MAVNHSLGTDARLAADLWGGSNVFDPGPTGPGTIEHAILQRGKAALLLPITPRRARAASVMRWTDDMSLPTVMARAALGAAMATGIAGPLIRTRVGVRVNSADPADQTLHEYLAEQLDVPEVVVAGAWGPPRPNQKPVLRLFDRDGRTIGFAKVGWNDLTKRLVDTEANFLAAAPTLRTMRVPRLISYGQWLDHSVSITEPVLGKPPLRKPTVPGPVMLNELAGISERYRSTLATSRYRKGIFARYKGDVPEKIIEALRMVQQSCGDVQLEFAYWHGDWTPWNMRSGGGRPIVWDWERSAPDFPVGFDAIHYAFHSSLARGTAPDKALSLALAGSRALLLAVGVDPAVIAPLGALYAIEMEVRFSSAPDQVPWLAGLLDTVISHLTEG